MEDNFNKGVDKFIPRVKEEKKYIQMLYNRRCSETKERVFIDNLRGRGY